MPTATTVPVKMAQRRDTAANWTSANPTLLAGEIGIESDTNKIKLGTGSTSWTSLGYTPWSQVSAYPLVNADIAAAAGIVDTKLATIATAGKVSNSATTATDANTASAIVSRNASGNFTAGTITAALTGAASSNVLKAGDTMTGALVVPLGAVGTPSLTFTGDTNTGIYSPGADQVAVATNGTGRLFVDASGKVGIGGVASPTDILDIGSGTLRIRNAPGDSNGLQIYQDTSDTSRIYNFYPGPLVFGTNNIERLRITSAGLVGIGTSSPQGLLDCSKAGKGGIVSLDSTAYAAGVGGTIDLGGNYRAAGDFQPFVRIAAEKTNSTNTDFGYNMGFYVTTNGGATFGTKALTIDSTGRLGIGTTGPTKALEVAAGGTSGNGILVTGSSSPRIQISVPSGSTILTTADTSAGYFGTSTNHPLSLFTNDTERARIDSSGRLLVGTSTARTVGEIISGTTYTVQANLQLESPNTDIGISLITNRSADSLGPFITLGKSRGNALGGVTVVQNGDELGNIYFAGADGTDIECIGAAIFAEVDGTPGANDMPGRLVFATTADGAASPTERMRITSDGRLKASTTGNYYDTNLGSSHELRMGDGTYILYCTNTKATGNIYGHQVYFSGQSPNDTVSTFFHAEDSTTLRAEIRSNGGLVNYSANNSNLSDINAKKDIAPAAGTWNCIKEWEIVNYRYKDQPDDADLNLGVIAQQVAESCPEVITIFQEAKEATEDKPAQEERLGVKEQQMYWMAIKALQEAMERIEQLETEMAAVKAQLA